MGICTVAAAEEAVAAQVVHAAVVGVDKAAREASEEAAERVGPEVGVREGGVGRWRAGTAAPTPFPPL